MTAVGVGKVLFCSVLFLVVLDPTVGHTMDVLSPFISVLCHSDWLFQGGSCPRIDIVGNDYVNITTVLPTYLLTYLLTYLFIYLITYILICLCGCCCYDSVKKRQRKRPVWIWRAVSAGRRTDVGQWVELYRTERPWNIRHSHTALACGFSWCLCLRISVLYQPHWPRLVLGGADWSGKLSEAFIHYLRMPIGKLCPQKPQLFSAIVYSARLPVKESIYQFIMPLPPTLPFPALLRSTAWFVYIVC